MNKTILRLVLTIALLTAGGNVLAQDQTCDRNCLSRMLDQYLEAVVANDPARAPLFVGFRQTENSVVIPLGDGVWHTMTELGPAQRKLFDTVTGQANFFGVIVEGEESSVGNVRVRVERGEITEAEWHIGRRGDPGIEGQPGGVLFDVDHLIASPPGERIVPPAERLPREALVAIANSYFDGITNQNARIIKAHRGCSRLENGQLVTGRPLPPERAHDGFEGRSDCTSGQGTFDVILVAARRYPVVDVEAQVVVASAVFMRTPGHPKRRNHFAELFYIDGSLIRDVYAAMFYADPLLPLPNWPPYEGNLPYAAELGPTR